MNKIKRVLLFAILPVFPALPAFSITDGFMEETLSGQTIEPPNVNLNYNYESLESIPIHLKILKKLSTKSTTVYEGQILEFEVKQDVKYNKHKIIKKGTIVKARVETYTTRGMNGIPASLIIDNFVIPNIDKNKIKGPFIKKGISLTLLVMPIKWALTPLPGVGSLTNLILGCNVTLTDKDNIVIYYHPNWNEFF